MNYNPKEALIGLGFSRDHADLIMKGLSAPDGLFLVTGISGTRKGVTLMELIKMAPLVPAVKTYESSFPSANGATESKQSLDHKFYVLPEFHSFTMAAACAEIINFRGRVFSKINASTVFDAPLRIQSFEKGPDGLSVEIKLSAIICQTCLGRPCGHCSLDYSEARNSLHEDVRFLIDSRINESDLQNLRFKNSEGCQHCRYGSSEFSFAAEVIVPNQEMLALFRKREFVEAREMFISQGGKFMFDHAIEKASKGIVDLEDIVKRIGVGPYI